MGQITLQIPQSGQLFSTEGPKVASDMTALQAVINGNLDTTNLSPSAAIALSQMVPGVLGLTGVVAVTTSGTLAANKWTEINANATTQTLPAPTLGQLVGVLLGTASTATIATSGATRIYGVGASFVSSIQMGAPGQVILLYANGTHWIIAAGRQDTGWVALTLGSGIVAAPVGFPPSARLSGDMVLLSGVLKNNTGGTAIIGTLLATVPSFAIPAQQSYYSAFETAAANSGGAQIEKVGDANPGGILNANTIAAGHFLSLDGWQYRLT